MVELIIGLILGLVLHCAWCQWGNKCDCDNEILQKLKSIKKKKGKK